MTINTVPLNDALYIKGRNAESKNPSEGLVTFDIIFDAFVPMDGEKAKVIINVEPQKNTQNIHSKLMKRAVYDVARLITSQKEFHGDNFNNLKKCFRFGYVWFRFIASDFYRIKNFGIKNFALRF